MSAQETPRPGRFVSAPDLHLIVPESAEQVKSAGVALLIIGIDPGLNGTNAIDPLIWTITELEGKPATGKKAGEISVPAETRKVGEDNLSNMIGALPELCSDDELAYVREHLFIAEDVFRDKAIRPGGNLQVDMAVLVYDGALSLRFSPLNSSEVAANGWVHRSEIIKMTNVRSILSQAVGIDMQEGLSAQALEIYHEHPELLKPAFPADFKTMADFYEKREMLEDVPLSRPQTAI